MQHTLVSNSTITQQSTLSTNLLSRAEIEALNARVSANADRWLTDNAPKAKSKTQLKLKSNRGRKPKILENPFYGFIGCTTLWGRYPAFAMDTIEGIARLDWHDRPTGIGGKSMPLSVRNLVVILESAPAITNEAVEDLLQLEERHARRYVKAIELIVPWMMKSRPQSLINEMDGIEPEPKACDWDDWDDACTPSAEELAKLHHDLRTLTEYKADYPTQPDRAVVVSLPNHHTLQKRQQHPEKPAVLGMLVQGQSVKAIERETGVAAKTIRKWRDEMQSSETELRAA